VCCAIRVVWSPVIPQGLGSWEDSLYAMEPTPLTIQEQIRAIIDDLPTLPPNSYPLEDSCPICLLPFSLILAEQEPSGDGRNMVSEVDHRQNSVLDHFSQSSELDHEYPGVTKLIGCGHVFCKKDLVEWIQNYVRTTLPSTLPDLFIIALLPLAWQLPNM
jgi:RING-type zinc-finger